MNAIRGEAPLTVGDKSFPAGAHGLYPDSLIAQGWTLKRLQTPVLTLDESAVRHNVSAMANWAADRGYLLAPHAKTTMSPSIWRLQLDAGAWGLTLATGWQALVALEAGAMRVMIANEVVDPIAIFSLASYLASHPERELVCWVDSVDAVTQMEKALAGSGQKLQVCLDVGAPGGRTGVRSVQQAILVAKRIHASKHLELVGQAGYEGALGHGSSRDAIEAVRVYLETFSSYIRELRPYFESNMPLITVGGSQYLDLAHAALHHVDSSAMTIILRPGAYVVHDSDFYELHGPDARGGGPGLVPAANLWTRVLSIPEPGLAILDAGRRDVGSDSGAPIPQLVTRQTDGHQVPLSATRIVQLNDQHAYATVPSPDSLSVGDVVRCGISHPCTTIDRWRAIPLIDSADNPDPTLTGVSRTWF